LVVRALHSVQLSPLHGPNVLSLTRSLACSLASSYREDDFASVGDAPEGFGNESDELIFSDHYDENPASAVELVADVKLWLDNGNSSVPKLPRDGRHFVCRNMWLTKEKRLLDLAVASVLDGEQRQRAMQLLRSLLKKSLGAKVPSAYKDPAGPFEVAVDDSRRKQQRSAPSSAKRKRSAATSDDDGGDDDDGDKSNKDDESDKGAAEKAKVKKAKSPPKKKTPSKKDKDKDATAGAVDDDDDGDAAEKKAAAKKAAVRRYPTFEEAEQLLLTRGELALLSTTKAFSEVVGGLVLLKHKDAAGAAQTTLIEIEKLPDVDAPYRPYPITYLSVDGTTEQVPDCVAGVELLMDSDAEASRRSLVNVRDRAIDRTDYDSWVAKSNPKSRFPATDKEINTLIARLEAVRKQYTRDKVKVPQPASK
jgi:hypothetical protein